jgi:DegV family protein with EDD domain
MQRKIQCRLILDSCCDLPIDVLEASNVEFLKFPFNMNDGERLDDMWKSTDAKEFYDRMRKGEVSGTAQIPVSELMRMFEQCAKDGVPTVYLAFTSGLSGTFDTVQTLSERLHESYPDFELYVVDTKLASIAEGVLAYEAINQRNRGLTAKQLAEWAMEARWYVNCLFTVDDLEYLRRGGRIPAAAASIGSKLNIKPLLAFNLDGTLAMIGIARGRKKSLKALVKTYDEDHAAGRGPNSTVLIASADADGDARWVEDHLDRPEESLPAVRCQIGPVIGSHVGPGMVACAFWGPDRRQNVSIADRIANKINAGGKDDD